METRLLKSEEVAAILQVSKAHAYVLMKRGEIPSVRIGKIVRVRPEDLERYIKEKAAQMKTPSAFGCARSDRKKDSLLLSGDPKIRTLIRYNLLSSYQHLTSRIAQASPLVPPVWTPQVTERRNEHG